MLSFITYKVTRMNSKDLHLSYRCKILIGIFITLEISFICYNLSNDPMFVSLVKFIVVCFILAPFLSIANHRNPSIEFEGMLSDNYKYSEEYRYFTEIEAYKQYERFNGKECGICLDQFELNYANKNSLTLLFCGHLFHKSCLKQNEDHKWKERHIYKPFGKCPLCRCKYDVKREKFRFNPNYWDSIHPLQRRFPSYGNFTYLSGLGL